MVDWATFSAVLVSDIPMRRCCYFSSHGGRCVGHISSRSPLSLHCLCPNNIWYTYTHKKLKKTDKSWLSWLRDWKYTEISEEKHTHRHTCAHTHTSTKRHSPRRLQFSAHITSSDKRQNATSGCMSRETFDSTHRFPTRGYTHTHTRRAHGRHTPWQQQSSAGLWREERGVSVYKERKRSMCVSVWQRFSWAAGSFFCRIRRDFCCFKVGFFKRFSPSFLTRILFLFLPSLSTSYLQSDFLSACVILKIQRSDLEHLLVPFFLFLL